MGLSEAIGSYASGEGCARYFGAVGGVPEFLAQSVV